jgi:carbon-monoxide dehydrogenase medium subunit
MYQAENSGLLSLSSRDLNAFKIVKPKTISEAVALLNDADSSPVAYAGGVDLVTAFRENKKIGTLVWLKEVDELSDISITKNTLRIGALITHGQVSGNEKLNIITGLQGAWGQIANVRIRFSATIGGNLMACRTSYEMPILLSALKATVNFRNKHELFTLAPDALFNNPRLKGALLTSIDIPIKDKPEIDYERSMRPLYSQATVKYQKNKLIRIVIATEYLRPFVFEILEGIDDYNQIFDNLPKDYSDLKLDNNYIRELIPIILKRQIKRLADNK